MKSKNIKKNILTICFIIIVFILLFNALILNNIKKEREEIYSKSIINNIRIKVKPSLDTAKNFIIDKSYKNKLTKELKHDNLKMAIISTNLKGTAIFYLNLKDVYVNRNMYLNKIIFLIILEIIFMILVLYGLIKKKILAPLNLLQKAAQQINAGDFHFEIPHSSYLRIFSPYKWNTYGYNNKFCYCSCILYI